MKSDDTIQMVFVGEDEDVPVTALITVSDQDITVSCSLYKSQEFPMTHFDTATLLANDSNLRSKFATTLVQPVSPDFFIVLTETEFLTRINLSTRQIVTLLEVSVEASLHVLPDLVASLEALVAGFTDV